MAKVRPLLLLSIGLLFVAKLAQATEAKPVVVSVERDHYGVEEQQALVFHADRVVLSRSSNFFCGPAVAVQLGAFGSAYTDSLKRAKAQAEQMFLRLSQATPDARPPHSTHAPQLFIGVREVTKSAAYALPTKKILELGCATTGFQPDQVIEATITPQKQLKVTALAGVNKGKSTERPLKDAGCKLTGKLDGAAVYECRIEKFGTALLIAK